MGSGNRQSLATGAPRTGGVKAPNRARSEKAKKKMMATLRAIRAGKVSPERMPAVLGTVSTIVDSFVLDHLGDRKK